MSAYARLARPLLFRSDAERAHDRGLRWAALAGRIPGLARLLRASWQCADARLRTEVAGITCANPLGLAAGFDKNGRAVAGLAALGFGHLEIGSVSAQPSAGNPRPRLFRLPLDQAIVVNYGLPNDGAPAVAARLSGRAFRAPVGLNIVRTNLGAGTGSETMAAVLADYVASARCLQPVAAYLCLNLSCPNTESGRSFFTGRAPVRALLQALAEAGMHVPVFLKVSPAGGVAAFEDVLAASEPFPFVAGFAVNLPPGKPAGLRTPPQVVRGMPGAVSGKPVQALVDECIRELFRRMERGRYHLIGAGGVFTAADAYARVRAGASLVQLLTALVYEGPGVVHHINRGLCRLLARDGFPSVSAAVGADAW